jgi:periplasmic protein CpxP/Spy
MFQVRSNSIILTMLIVAATTHVAYAESVPPNAQPIENHEGGPEGCPWKRGDHEKHFEEKLKNLHESLKLSAAQEPAWQTWSNQLLADRAKWKSKHEEESTPPAKALDRLEKKLAHLKEKEKHLESHIVATKTFYAELTPAQKQTFDSEFAKRGGKHHPPKDHD